MKKWFYRTFKVITTEQAVEWKLIHRYNIYGDLINQINCRSVWADSNGRLYRVKELFNTNLD
jgi:hypothetical protein